MQDSAEMTPSPLPTGDPTRERLDDQINWYDRKSTVSKRYFYALKLVTIVAAALIPLLAALPVDREFSRAATAALGALIVVIEGLQQL